MATVEEVSYILRDAAPEVVFTSVRNREKAETAIREAGIDCKLLVIEELPSVGSGTTPVPFPDAVMDDTAVIIYTSGTTGSPKGVMLSFMNLFVNLTAVSDEVPIYIPEDRLLVLLPLHHILPLQGTVIMPLKINATCVLAASMTAPDILDALSRHHVTMMIGVPRLYSLLRDGIKSKIRASFAARTLFALSRSCNSLAFSRFLFRSVQKKFGGSFRYMPCGGAALEPDIIRDFRALGFEILVGYGMTETSPMISFTRPGTGGRRGAAGQLLTSNEVRISDDGEITVRGANVMKGYYKRPEETAAVLRDGWLHTGDQGYVDADNYIFITGRKKEIIVLPNGKNINPEEVENKLLGMGTWLAEAAVLPSGDGLQAILLPDFKALRAASVLNIEESIRQQVVSAYNEQASSYKRILKCTFVSEPLPRTRMGKLKRHELPAIVANSAAGTVNKKHHPEPDTEEYRVIKEFLVGRTGDPVFPDDHFELDLSMDSLGKVAFQVFLSGTFGLEVTDQMLLDNPTPEKLAEAIRKSSATGVVGTKTFKWGELLKEKVHVNLPRPRLTHIWLNFVSKILLRCAFCLHGSGMENIPEGPCIFAPNHQSYLDALFVSAFLNAKTLRETYFYAKAEHLRHWWQRFLANRHNVIVMNVNSDLKRSIQQLAGVLRKGHKIIIFPEGTRTLDGQLGSFKQLFAILCCELNVPIVPVALDGAFEALPRTRRMPRFFRNVNVTFLTPVRPVVNEDYDGIVDRAINEIKPQLGHASARG